LPRAPYPPGPLSPHLGGKGEGKEKKKRAEGEEREQRDAAGPDLLRSSPLPLSPEIGGKGAGGIGGECSDISADVLVHLFGEGPATGDARIPRG